MSTNNTISITVGKHQVAESKRAVSLTRKKKQGVYDSIEWKTSDSDTFTVDFGSAGKSPFNNGFSFNVSKNSPQTVSQIKNTVAAATSFKYSIKDSTGNLIDDPFVIIED